MLAVAIAVARKRFDEAWRAYHKQDDFINRWFDIWFHDEVDEEEGKLDCLLDEAMQITNVMGEYAPD